jgi:hypothetical protein
MTNWEKREAEIVNKLVQQGYTPLDTTSAYGPSVTYVMVRVKGLKNPVRRAVTRTSYENVRASLKTSI